jgi:glycosyltransferase involved in cell wall biosynthesis
MRLLFIGQGRFVQFSDKEVYPLNSLFNYNYFERYLEVFDDIIVLGRLWRQNGLPSKNMRATTGPHISFLGSPPFATVGQFLKYIPRIRKTIKLAVAQADAFILRVPNYFSFLARKEIGQRGLPYAVEVVGDPWDVFQSGAVEHPLRPIIRWLSTYELRKTCIAASCAAYVTKNILQQKYPPSQNAFSTYYSSIDLPSEWIMSEPRIYSGTPRRLVFVGTLEVLYKGLDVLLEALKILADRGIPMHLDVVGDGRCRPQLEALVNRLNLNQQIIFHGKVPHQEVSSILDGADLFVLPSRQEGLPRAMIEAMARALPCIGSTAGGIPELLPPEDMVPPGDALALAYKIMEVAQNPPRMTAMSARNLATAQEYRNEVLQGRRIQFYRHVRELAEKARKG